MLTPRALFGRPATGEVLSSGMYVENCSRIPDGRHSSKTQDTLRCMSNTRLAMRVCHHDGMLSSWQLLEERTYP